MKSTATTATTTATMVYGRRDAVQALVDRHGAETFTTVSNGGQRLTSKLISWDDGYLSMWYAAKVFADIPGWKHRVCAGADGGWMSAVRV
jgi:hypothetical protein